MFVEYLALFLMFMMACAFVCAFIYIPIMIANQRGICGGKRMLIILLAWMGVFFGVTWFAALILSLVLRGDCVIENLDKLEKLTRLYKEKIITKSEFDAMRAKLLKND